MILVKVKQSVRITGGWGSKISRQLALEGGKVVSPTHRPSLRPRKYSWYSFLLEAQSTPGYSAAGRIKNSIDTIGNRTRELSSCSSVPQPTAPPAAYPRWNYTDRGKQEYREVYFASLWAIVVQRGRTLSYSSTFFVTTGWVVIAVPRPLYCGKENWYSLPSRLAGTLCCYWWVRRKK